MEKYTKNTPEIRNHVLSWSNGTLEAKRHDAMAFGDWENREQKS